MSKWLRFLRHYGPINRNDNMYDETIQRSARKQGIQPIQFEHPFERRVIDSFSRATTDPVSVILTGTAGDGKTHLCRHVWKALGGHADAWSSDDPYLSLVFAYPKDRLQWPDVDDPTLLRPVRIHFIRDLSSWAPQQGDAWDPQKEALLQAFCSSLFSADENDVFLIAANDGQLIEAFRRLTPTDAVTRARGLFEELLVEDRQDHPSARLRFFNLSRASSADLFDRALAKFLAHPGWEELRSASAPSNGLFGLRCPIRRNYELLSTPLVQARLRALFTLCDYNGMHVPIRQILLLLANAVLGHPDVPQHLMLPGDVQRVIAKGTVSKASLYSNIFGANLSDLRRESITIFELLGRFQIGHETSNRIDNLLIFGDADDTLRGYFERFLRSDDFYGADARYEAAKKEYIEGTGEDEATDQQLLGMLVAQRRGLFFKIPQDLEVELKLWELTVFSFAGEYLSDLVSTLERGDQVRRPLLSRLVKGLNRVFTGMLVSTDRELFLATSGNYSQSRVSRILVERVSVEPSKGEKVVVRRDEANGRVLLSVFFAQDISVDFTLTLVRYEFLSRIALEGALPASFSKECYEDLLAFKSQLIAAFLKRQARDGGPSTSRLALTLLALTDQGTPDPLAVEVTP